MAGLRTEFEFVLPRGYLDDHGALHTRGTMRLATARDELAAWTIADGSYEPLALE